MTDPVAELVRKSGALRSGRSATWARQPHEQTRKKNDRPIHRIADPQRQILNVVGQERRAVLSTRLRGTFGSIVSRLGDHLNDYTTKRLSNHRTSDVTQGHIHFDFEQLRSAMQAVEDDKVRLL